MHHFPPRYHNATPGPRRTPFASGGMLAGSVATGAMFTIWNRAIYQVDPVKKYAVLAIGSALVGITQEFFRTILNKGMSR
jgi:hypothetical protein